MFKKQVALLLALSLPASAAQIRVQAPVVQTPAAHLAVPELTPVSNPGLELSPISALPALDAPPALALPEAAVSAAAEAAVFHAAPAKARPSPEPVETAETRATPTTQKVSAAMKAAPLGARFWDGAGRNAHVPAVDASGAAPPSANSLDAASGGADSPQPPPAPSTGFSPQRSITWLAFAWNFLTISVFYMLAPLRSGMLLAHVGPSGLPWVYMLSALATGGAVWVYARAAGVPRARFIPGAVAVLSASLLGWGGIFALAGTSAPLVGVGFYVWVDVFAIMSVTLLWTYLNDIYGPEAAKRSFSSIAAAGSLGAIAGSLFIKSWVRSISPAWALAGAGLVYALSILVFRLMERRAGRSGAAPPEKRDLGRPLEAFKAIWASPYLTLLTAVVALERFVPDLADYLFGSAARALYSDEKALTVLSATFSLWESVAAVIIGTLLGSYLMKKLGVRAALASAPWVNFLGFLSFLLVPILPVVVVHNALDGVARHTVFKGGKETLYTVEKRDVIYKIKAYIEMFVYRFSRGLAGLTLLAMTGLLGMGPAGIAVLGAAAAGLWVWASWRLGKKFSDVVQ